MARPGTGTCNKEKQYLVQKVPVLDILYYCTASSTSYMYVHARTQSATSELESAASSFTGSMLVGEENLSLLSKTGGRRKKKGCWMNCKSMCCSKQVMSQDRLLQVYLAEATESSRTSVMD